MKSIKSKILDNIETLIEKKSADLEDCSYKNHDWQNMIIEQLIDVLQYQQKEISHLRKGLKIYANPKNYKGDRGEFWNLIRDGGSTARRYLGVEDD